MSDKIVAYKDALTATADAIREKTGSADLLEWVSESGFAEAVAGIETDKPTLAKSIVERTITEISDDTITSIGYGAFQNCAALTTVNLPAAISIGSYAFYYCTALTTVDLPVVATSIGEYTFYGCAALTTVNLPAATKIGNGAFPNCAALTTVDLPAATSIGRNAFDSCAALTTVDLPAAASIGNYAFDSCSALNALILRNTEKVCTLSNTNAFNSTPFASGSTGGILLVPSVQLESYKTATNWSTIYGYGTNQFLALENFTVDGTTTGEIDWDKLNAA